MESLEYCRSVCILSSSVCDPVRLIDVHGRFELDADPELLFSVENTYKTTDKSSKTKPLPFHNISMSPNDQVVATVTGSNINVSPGHSLIG